jgi:hypothetical protein
MKECGQLPLDFAVTTSGDKKSLDYHLFQFFN